MFSISLVRISPSVAKVTGRRLAHFHILTDVLVELQWGQNFSLLPSSICVHMYNYAFVCVFECAPTHRQKGQGYWMGAQRVSSTEEKQCEWRRCGGREGLKHCGLFHCGLIEVTILMSVTSSCHDKPLWVKPVLSLAGSLLLLRCSYSTSPSLPTKGANLTTIMHERGRLVNRKHRCVSVIS